MIFRHFFPRAMHAAVLVCLLTIGTCLTAAAQEQNSASPNLFAGFGSKSDAPYEISAHELTVFDDRNIAILTGDVHVVQDLSLLKTPYLKVFYRDAGEGGSESQGIRRIEAREGVYIESGTQIATGKQADYDAETEIMVMTGDVVLIDGCNVIRGNKLHVNLRTGKSKITASTDGRIDLLLKPNSGTPESECGTN